MSLKVVWLVWWIFCLIFCCILHVLGRGVVASKQTEFGQFICEYFGELISAEEGEERERLKASCFRYFFSLQRRCTLVSIGDLSEFWSFVMAAGFSCACQTESMSFILLQFFFASFSCSPSSTTCLNLTAYLGMHQCSNWSSCDSDSDRNMVRFVLGTFSQMRTQCVALDHYWGC